MDYYGARYYDPVVGVFLSADAVQGDLQGMNPYGYVKGNPETFGDPTGTYRAPVCLSSCSGGTTTTPVSLPPPSKQGTTSTSDGWPFGHIHPGPIIAQIARLLAMVALGKTKSAVSSLLTLISLTNIPIPDPEALPFPGYSSLNDEAHGQFAGFLDWIFGKEVVDEAASQLGKLVDGYILITTVKDLFTGNDTVQKVADGFTALAYTLSLLKGAFSELLSKLFNLDSSDVADGLTIGSLVLGGIGFIISLANAPFVPHAGNGNDTGNDNRRHSNGGGPPFPPFPPTLPPAANQVTNVGNQEISTSTVGWNI